MNILQILSSSIKPLLQNFTDHICINILVQKKKLEAFVDNYTFIDKVFPASLKTKLYKDGIAEIAAFDVQNGKKYTIDLIMYSEYAKEGELSLKIKNEDNILLATLTFSFIRDNAYEVL